MKLWPLAARRVASCAPRRFTSQIAILGMHGEGLTLTALSYDINMYISLQTMYLKDTIQLLLGFIVIYQFIVIAFSNISEFRAHSENLFLIDMR